MAIVLSAGASVAVGGSAPGPDVPAIQRWLAAAHRSPTIRQRLSAIYTAVLLLAIGGTVVYGTASTALAQVVSSDSVARWGPSVVLLALLGAAHWGTVQGPVVFSMADVGQLLGAPLPRAALVARPLRRAFFVGFCGGVAVTVVLLFGLTGDGRIVAVARMLGLAGGLGLSGVIAVGLAWMVSISARAELVLRRVTWPVVAVAGGLAIGAGLGGGRGADGGAVVGAVGVGGPGWSWCLVCGVGLRVGRACVFCICGRGIRLAAPGLRRVRAVRAPGRGPGGAAGIADVVRRADQPSRAGFRCAAVWCEWSR